MSRLISPTPCTLVIFCPLAFERTGIQRVLRARRADPTHAADFHLIQSGPGPARIAASVEAALSAGPIHAAHASSRPVVAILAGVAGELAPVTGAIIAADVRDAHGNTWRSPFAGAAFVNPHSILGLDEPAGTPDLKRDWRERSGCSLVDTESHAFARTCDQHAIPWLVLRAASDRRHESLPTQTADWVDAAGNTRISRVLLDLVRAPSLLPSLIRLGRRGAAATRLVGERLSSLVGSPPFVSFASTAPAPLIHVASAPVSPPVSSLPAATLAAPLLIFFGGSFDPPHLAHVRLPLLVREELERRLGCPGLAHIIYVPAARSPHKAGGPLASDDDRVAMLRLALRDAPRTTVWTDELDRAHAHEGEHAIFPAPPLAPRPPSYTITTIERLRSLLDDPRSRPPASHAPVIRLLLGEDQVRSFHRWKDARRLIELAEPVAMRRPDAADAPPVSLASLMDDLRATGAWSDADLRAWNDRFVDLPAMPHRATSARDALQRGIAPGDLLDPLVLEYITLHALYR